MKILGLHHIQLGAPPNTEPQIRKFFGEVMGMEEIQKPANLAARGGAWFRFGANELHIGIDARHNAADRAHPAFLVDSFEEVRQRLQHYGYAPYEDEPLPGFRRFYCRDPFGNRLEFLEPLK